MNGYEVPLLVLLIGALVVLSILLKWGLNRAGVTPVVGYLILGFLLRLSVQWDGILTGPISHGLELMGTLGITILLFRVGLESDLGGLVRQLRRAEWIWLGNVLVSGGCGYLAARYVLGLEVIPCLFVSVALTATSVGVPVAVWHDSGKLDSDEGELLLDIAAMDDLSAVVLMALLLTLTPMLQDGIGGDAGAIASQVGWLVLKLALFGALTYLFAKYAERRLTHFFLEMEGEGKEEGERMADPMLMVIGTGFIIASLAGLLGFSVAVGAFFAGIAFSNDPDAVKVETRFDVLYDLFVPFFFIHIGLLVDPTVLDAAILPGLILLTAAVLGKLVGTMAPALPSMEWNGALLLGLSMIPRAEITMVIMQRGRELGDWAVSSSVFSAMVFVAALTCLMVPLVMRPLLSGQHGKKEGES